MEEQDEHRRDMGNRTGQDKIGSSRLVRRCDVLCVAFFS